MGNISYFVFGNESGQHFYCKAIIEGGLEKGNWDGFIKRGIVLINVGHYGGDQSQKDTPISIDEKLFRGNHHHRRMTGLLKGKRQTFVYQRTEGVFLIFMSFRSRKRSYIMCPYLGFRSQHSVSYFRDSLGLVFSWARLAQSY